MVSRNRGDISFHGKPLIRSAPVNNPCPSFFNQLKLNSLSHQQAKTKYDKRVSRAGWVKGVILCGKETRE